ncbi:MAG TPA: class I SAM-dependent methyltransferase [Thermoanaerobaculia bacterium]
MNQLKLRLLLSRAWHDVAAAQSAALVVAGDRNGWFRALAQGPADATQLAAATNADEPLLRMWLVNQANAGFITFDAASGRYSLDEEQAAVFTDDSVPAGFELAATLTRGDDATAAIDRMSASNARQLAARWLADDLRGGTILDVGCGRGGVARELARQFPDARIHGIDVRDVPADEERITFAIADAATVSGTYDVALLVDVLHELRDPAAVLAHLREHARAIVIVEPLFEDGVSARLMSSAAFLFCLPAAGAATFRDEAALRELLTAAGFTAITRRDDPSHLVLEGR